MKNISGIVSERTTVPYIDWDPTDESVLHQRDVLCHYHNLVDIDSFDHPSKQQYSLTCAWQEFLLKKASNIKLKKMLRTIHIEALSAWEIWVYASLSEVRHTTSVFYVVVFEYGLIHVLTTLTIRILGFMFQHNKHTTNL